MEDFYEGLIDPPSGINPLTDNGVVPWSILLAPSGPPRTALGRFPSQRAEARERERQQFAAIDDPGERAADRMRTSAKPAGGREEGNMTVFADHIVPYVQSRISHLAELPQRAIGESHRYALTGDYDIGPALESATLPMAGTFFAGARGVGAGPTRPPRTHPADAMGFRRDMPIEFSIVPEGEKLAAAAIDVNGRIVTARTHAEAALKAEKFSACPWSK